MSTDSSRSLCLGGKGSYYCPRAETEARRKSPWGCSDLFSLLIPDDFRIFCGDLGNEVNDDILARAFSRFPSFLKAKVIRDKRTGKTKGYGFVSFKDPSDYVRAMREMNGG